MDLYIETTHTKPQRVDDDETDAVILYAPSTINFWRTGLVLEFLTVEHKKHDVIEIIPRIIKHSLECSRTYISTEMLLSNFTKEEVDAQVAIKKADFNMTKKYNTFAFEPADLELREKILQDLSVQYIKARLVVPLGGPIDVWLSALPGDKVKPDGQPDYIIEKPENLMKYEIHKASVSKTLRAKKSWASSLRAIDPDWAIQNFPEGLGRSLETSSEPTGPSVEEIEAVALRVKRIITWKNIFRRFILIMEITKTKRRLETITIGNALSCDALSCHFDSKTLGKNSRRYSKIFEIIVAGPVPKSDNAPSLLQPDNDCDSLAPSTLTYSSSQETLPSKVSSSLLSVESTASHKYHRAESAQFRSPSRRMSDRVDSGLDMKQSQSTSGTHSPPLSPLKNNLRGSVAPLHPSERRGFERSPPIMSPPTKLVNRRSTEMSVPLLSEERSPRRSTTSAIKPIDRSSKENHLSFDSRESQKTKHSLKPLINSQSCDKLMENSIAENTTVKVHSKRLSAIGTARSASMSSRDHELLSSKDPGKELLSGKELRSSRTPSRRISLEGSSTHRRSSTEGSPQGSAQGSAYTSRRASAMPDDSPYSRKKPPPEEVPRAKLLMDHLRGNLSFTKLLGALSNIRESFHLSERIPANIGSERSTVRRTKSIRDTLRGKVETLREETLKSCSMDDMTFNPCEEEIVSLAEEIAAAKIESVSTPDDEEGGSGCKSEYDSKCHPEYDSKSHQQSPQEGKVGLNDNAEILGIVTLDIDNAFTTMTMAP